MKFIFSLALKNLFRHRRRTLITAIAIAYGIAMYIFIDAMLLGAEKDSERNVIWYESGPAKVYQKEYWDERQFLPLKYNIDSPEAVQAYFTEKRIETTPRITFGGELFFGEGSLPVKLIGIDPRTDGRVFRLEETLVEGSRYLSQDQPEILVGEWLAEDLGAGLGDLVEVRTRTRDGAMQTMELEIVGILNCPNPVINKGTGIIPIDVAAADLDMTGHVTEVVLALPEIKKIEKVVDSLNRDFTARFPDLTILSWEIMAADFLAMAQAKTVGTNIIIFLILIIAAVGITNTMLIAVFERVREIGMMRALGMKDSAIRLSFLVEAGGIGVLGSIIGLILGSAATFWIVHWGIDFRGLIGRMDIGYRIQAIFRGAWNPPAMITAFVLGTLVSMVIALMPASRALRMKITDCLRQE